MVKKLKYLLFLIPFLFLQNVNALQLGRPETFTYYSDGSEVTGYASSSSLWGTDNYWGAQGLIGEFTNASPRGTGSHFFWNGANLCQDENISISGTIVVWQNFFDEQAYHVDLVMNNKNLTCSITKENSSRIKYTCFGSGGGNFSIFFTQDSFNGSYKSYGVNVSKDVELSCDVSNSAIVSQSITNTQNIINNNNQNTQNIINSQNQTTNAINDVNDSINDTSSPNTNQNINEMNNMVASDTPISDLITLPITLLNSYINGLNSSCSPVNLGSLLGTNITIPCIDIPSKIGNDLWSKIDVLCCIFMCYQIAMLFITAFDGITSLRDDFEGLYQPKHSNAAYKPKHGGDS